MVMRSSPAWPSRPSSLPNALTENGQVGSRNTSKMRGPWPQTSGSAHHVFFIRSFLFHLVRTRQGPKGDEAAGLRKPPCYPIPNTSRVSALDLDLVCKGNNGHYAPFAWAA